MKFFIGKNPTRLGIYYLMVYKGHRGKKYYLHNDLSYVDCAYKSDSVNAWHNTIESALKVAKNYQKLFNDSEEITVVFGKHILKEF